MPNRPSNAVAWYYEDFLPLVQGIDLHENQAADWKRLRIWDGNELKPALPEGFTGRPSEAQMENLFEAMKQGNLFIFDLGRTDPSRIDYGTQRTFPVDPKEPEPLPPIPEEPKEPEVPNPNEYANKDLELTNEQREQYAAQWKKYSYDKLDRTNQINNRPHAEAKYNRQMQDYKDGKAFLEKAGDAYRNSVNKINEERASGMEQEQKLREVRRINKTHSEFQRKRASMDDVITNIMAPRPVAVPNLFFGGDSNAPTDKHPAPTSTDATFSYETYDKVLEANGYDLMPNDKISEYEAATIHMMIMGAGKHMTDFTQNHLEMGGPLSSQLHAQEGFNMIMTGMFGINRKHQPSAPTMGEALRVGKDVIQKYIDGDPQPLADLLADGFQTIKRDLSSISQRNLTADTVAVTKVVERMLKLLDTHPDLMEAAHLQEQDVQFMRGYVKMGEVYDHYLDGQMKLNEAAVMEKPLSEDEKKQILVDIAIQKMVAAQMEKEVDAFTESEAYLQMVMEANQKDQELKAAEEKILEDQGLSIKTEDTEKRTNAYLEYKKNHDASGVYTEQLNAMSIERKIVNWLGEAGNYERLHQNLMTDPAIAKLAQKPEAELKTLLESGDGIKQLTEQAQKAQDVMSSSSVWYGALKTRMLDGRPEHDLNAISPWINANVATDANRLMIAVTNADGTKSLKSVASLLENGLEDLRDPSATTLDMMYRYSLDGNLYYYDVGKDMPMRLHSDDKKITVEQLEFHEAPTLWMRIANFLTFGYAYADIVHPEADRDPAAYDAIVQARDERAKVAQNEAASRHDQARSSNQKGIGERFEQENNFSRIQTNEKVVYPTYAENAIQQKMAFILTGDRHLMTTAVAQLNALSTYEANAAMSGKGSAEPDKLREIMAMMVLVAAAKQEKALNKEGGPFAQRIGEDPNAAIEAMKQDKLFQKFTENVSMDMFKHFVMVDGAKNMHKAMQKAVLEQSAKPDKGVENNEKNLDHQNERDAIMNMF